MVALPCLADWGKGPNGRFWNGWSPWFINAPTLWFKAADGARSYRFEVTDDFHRRTVLTSDKAEVSLDGDWTLDWFVQPATGAVRALPLAVPVYFIAKRISGAQRVG